MAPGQEINTQRQARVSLTRALTRRPDLRRNTATAPVKRTARRHGG